MAERAPDNLSWLRQRAESQLSRIVTKAVPSLTPENIEALVHELRVHQIELEMQCHELEQAHRDIEESRNTYRDLYESIPIGYATIDSAGRIRDLNPAGAALLGLESERRAQHNFHRFFEDEEAERFTRFTRQVMSSQAAAAAEFTMRRADGPGFMAMLQGMPVKTGGGQDERLRIAFQDVTARVTAETAVRKHQAELEASRSELQDLTERLFMAQEDERKRIACDIHDDHCQQVTALILEARALVRLSELQAPSLAARIKVLSENLRGILDDFRSLSHQLHPRDLDTLSLAGAMRQLVEEFSAARGLPVEWSERDAFESLPPVVATCLYRLLQESLNNISKHANATHVVVMLAGNKDGIELVVKDDGTGFDLGRPAEGRKGLGLLSMHERLRPLAGKVRIDTKPGQGTTLTFDIPLRRQA